MRVWLGDRDMVLAECLQNDSRGDNMDQTTCGCCEQELPEYQCNDCFGGEMFCKVCVVDLHAMHPLHRVEVRFYFQII